jgi:hypothetical protein
MPIPAGTCDQGNRRRAGRVGSNLLPRFQMKERPILFSGPMVRAIIKGRKTQTRRVVKLPAKYPAKPIHPVYLPWACQWQNGFVPCPYGQPGARLWVRETFGLCSYHDVTAWDGGSIRGIAEAGIRLEYNVEYAADWDGRNQEACRWRPSIFMPRWASRITLEVTGVRVERLQDISEADAVAEGVDSSMPCGALDNGTSECHPRCQYKGLWESINGPGAWDANPWVWVVEFKRS